MLNSKQRAFLKKKSQKLQAVVRIGKEGLTDNIIESVVTAINKPELIKVKILQNLDTDSNQVKEIANELAQKSGTEIVGVVGRVIVLYKENEKKPIISDEVKKIK